MSLGLEMAAWSWSCKDTQSWRNTGRDEHRENEDTEMPYKERGPQPPGTTRAHGGALSTVGKPWVQPPLVSTSFELEHSNESS